MKRLLPFALALALACGSDSVGPPEPPPPPPPPPSAVGRFTAWGFTQCQVGTSAVFGCDTPVSPQDTFFARTVYLEDLAWEIEPEQPIRLRAVVTDKATGTAYPAVFGPYIETSHRFALHVQNPATYGLLWELWDAQGRVVADTTFVVTFRPPPPQEPLP